MGQCCGTVYDHNESLKRWRPQFEGLGLKEECIAKLNRLFSSADISHDGYIDSLELLMLLDMERTPFTERIFKVFDRDGNGVVDFREFAFATWNFCTLNDDFMTYFIFELYDDDHSNLLEEVDVVRMLKELYGPKYETSKAVKDLQVDIPKMAGAEIDIEEFRRIVQCYSGLLRPSNHILTKFREGTMGEEYWIGKTHERNQFSHGRYVSMEGILKKKFSTDATLFGPKKKRSKRATNKSGTGKAKAITNSKVYADSKSNKSSDKQSHNDIASDGSGKHYDDEKHHDNHYHKGHHDDKHHNDHHDKNHHGHHDAHAGDEKHHKSNSHLNGSSNVPHSPKKAAHH